jgi:hypothetical protein
VVIEVMQGRRHQGGQRGLLQRTTAHSLIEPAFTRSCTWRASSSRAASNLVGRLARAVTPGRALPVGQLS